jgi:uncharacterized protein Yka (UPF0111/DUF47 family)
MSNTKEKALISKINKTEDQIDKLRGELIRLRQLLSTTRSKTKSKVKRWIGK